jgi:hypothetical protein
MRFRSRMITRVTVFVLLGAIVNVTVAWGSACVSEQSDWTFYSPYSTEHVLGESRFGWPARSLSNDPAPVFGRPRPYVLTVGEMRLPSLPLWPGFAINTLFYAGILWLLFAAPFALRRRSRTKRGLCPSCGYDLRGCVSQTCAECGRAVMPNAATASDAA